MSKISSLFVTGGLAMVLALGCATKDVDTASETPGAQGGSAGSGGGQGGSGGASGASGSAGDGGSAGSGGQGGPLTGDEDRFGVAAEDVTTTYNVTYTPGTLEVSAEGMQALTAADKKNPQLSLRYRQTHQRRCQLYRRPDRHSSQSGLWKSHERDHRGQ